MEKYDQNKHVYLVVLYKVAPLESVTISSILDKLPNICDTETSASQLIIWDNSPDSSRHEIEILRARLPMIDVSYVHTPENRSLSSIYNEVLSTISEDDFLTLLDQDTVLPESFFNDVRIAISKRWPLILPQVICQGVLVSPGGRVFARGTRFNKIDPGARASKNLLAINSGMTVMGKVFQSFNYDERLRFYGTDTYFMRNYEKYYNQVFILDSKIQHSLAEMEDKTREWKINHFEEKLRTFDIIFDNSLIEVSMMKLYSLLLRIRTHITGF